jgi:hypothetical protein
MRISKGEGSLVLEAPLFEGSYPATLNKLHLGEEGGLHFLAPHAENMDCHNMLGPRADLWWFDDEYREMWLKEMEEWLDPEYKRTFIDTKYGKKTEEHFNVPYRRRQLDISDKGVRKKRREITELSKRGTWVFERTEDIQKLTKEGFILAHQLADSYVHKGKEGIPKIIINPTVHNMVSEIHDTLIAVLGRIDQEIGPDMEDQVLCYWDQAASWENE